MAGISQRAYARHRGVSHRAVQKAIKAARITTNPDGTIDPARADSEWVLNTDPASSAGHEIIEQNELRDSLDRRAPRAQQRPGRRGGISEPPTTGGYLASRAVREAYRARREKLAYERESGSLVRADEVRAAAFDFWQRIREHLLTLADRIAPVVAGLSDGRECHRVIAEEVNRLLAEVQARKGYEPS
jgi:hypothetical protein